MKKLLIWVMAIALIFVAGMVALSVITSKPATSPYIDPRIREAETQARLDELNRNAVMGWLWQLTGLGVVIFFSALGGYVVVSRNASHIKQKTLDGEVDREIKLTHLYPDNNGNKPDLVDLRRQITYSPNPGNPAVQYPALTHLTLHQKDGKTAILEQPAAAPALPGAEPTVRPLSAREALDLLPENELKMCFGLDERGNPQVFSLVEAVHILLAASTGMGKSSLAAQIITHLIVKNEPGMVNLALIDVKGTTAKWLAPFCKLVATDMPGIIAIVKKMRAEVDRRKAHGLVNEPLWLVVCEEALAVQIYMDGETKKAYAQDLAVITLMGREFGIFVNWITQVDYASPEFKNQRGMYGSRLAGAVMPKAAESMGFTEKDAYNRLWKERKPGQFLLENVSGGRIITAPRIDLKRGELAELLPVQSSSTVQNRTAPRRTIEVNPELLNWQNSAFESHEPEFSDPSSQPQNSANESEFAAIVRRLRKQNKGKNAIIEIVWGAKPGGTEAYKKACAAYDAITD